MLTKTEALELISSKLQQIGTPTDPFVVVEKSTIEKPFGWVFFYNSKKFVDTGVSRYRLAGNGPVIVDKFTGTVEFYGSGKPVEEIIQDYEKELAPKGRDKK
jgi:hypothetical protein